MVVKTGINPETVEIAKSLMKIMLYDNGAVNAQEPETDKRYPKWCVNAIAEAAGVFFSNNPEFLTDEHLDQIAAGEYGENQRMYGSKPGYKDLDKALGVFFDVM